MLLRLFRRIFPAPRKPPSKPVQSSDAFDAAIDDIVSFIGVSFRDEMRRSQAQRAHIRTLFENTGSVLDVRRRLVSPVDGSVFEAVRITCSCYGARCFEIRCDGKALSSLAGGALNDRGHAASLFAAEQCIENEVMKQVRKSGKDILPASGASFEFA